MLKKRTGRGKDTGRRRFVSGHGLEAQRNLETPKTSKRNLFVAPDQSTNVRARRLCSDFDLRGFAEPQSPNRETLVSMSLGLMRNQQANKYFRRVTRSLR